jgi:hypothetical protein
MLIVDGEVSTVETTSSVLGTFALVREVFGLSLAVERVESA